VLRIQRGRAGHAEPEESVRPPDDRHPLDPDHILERDLLSAGRLLDAIGPLGPLDTDSGSIERGGASPGRGGQRHRGAEEPVTEPVYGYGQG
jgi:hypothetical protein